MPLSAEDRERFLSSLRSDEAFREEVRRQVLTEELLSLPERFVALVGEVHALAERLDVFVEATDRRLASLERQVTRLADDYGDLRGAVLEQQVRQNPGYYLHKYAKRVRVVTLDELLDRQGSPFLSEEEEAVLARTDVLATGVSRARGGPVVFAIEATWRPHSGDVERDVRRRDVLADKGIEALAVIVSIKTATEGVARLAEASGVALESAERKDGEPTEAA